MVKTSIQELCDLGQSIWLDNINRSMIESGALQKLIGLGLRGMTSNPTIFDKAISNSTDYDKKIAALSGQGKSTFDIYDELTIKDIQDAADILKPIYIRTNGLDGYVSLEINPELAYDVSATVKEGKRLHEKVNRQNLMLKVPSTDEGFEAIEELLALGINVNVTLIFSVDQYSNTAHAYMRGVKRALENGKDVKKVRSVASVFVSRIDSVIDKILDEEITAEKDNMVKDKLSSLKGRAAVANSKLIYKKYLDILASKEFSQLHKAGVNTQRVLWGSTSTKNPDYSDIKYVAELIGKNTVNTVPDNTLEAFLDHGITKEALTDDIKDAEDIIKKLAEYDIDVDAVCVKLLRDGVVAFQSSFKALLHSIEEKQKGGVRR